MDVLEELISGWSNELELVKVTLNQACTIAFGFKGTENSNKHKHGDSHVATIS